MNGIMLYMFCVQPRSARNGIELAIFASDLNSAKNGERVQTSNLSDKTAQIALDYQERRERINREWYEQKAIYSEETGPNLTEMNEKWDHWGWSKYVILFFF